MSIQEIKRRHDGARALAKRLFDDLCIDEHGDWVDRATVTSLLTTVKVALDCQLYAYECE